MTLGGVCAEADGAQAVVAAVDTDDDERDVRLGGIGVGPLLDGPRTLDLVARGLFKGLLGVSGST
ncbi:hypothetical protein BW730_07130 [Tessaracoccus aquimaris]|uniref:Uncharacterized protein n=1 Tax=Tessaracoccus aquimaris TaxID=1332264 RepID=A0A1Q2CMF6_9ACTN|nr:hypothetical protein BW730_07130 [Tessaracoccus aquimaris]